LSDQDQKQRGRGVKVAVQLVGFAIGIALLWWCVHLALSPENREQLENLRDAPSRMIAGLLVLSLTTFMLNGFMLWVVLLPTRRLRLTQVLAVNALATLLAYLPFKMSVLSRFVLHNRRDGMPIMRIGAWLAAFLVITLATMGPFVVASVLIGEMNAAWFAIACGLLALSYGSLIGLSRDISVGAPPRSAMPSILGRAIDQVWSIAGGATIPPNRVVAANSSSR
jgi:hypothetical protein